MKGENHMLTDLDIIELIINELDTNKSDHDRLKLNLTFHKHDYADKLVNSLKYKNKYICLMAVYKEIRNDILNEVSRNLP